MHGFQGLSTDRAAMAKVNKFTYLYIYIHQLSKLFNNLGITVYPANMV